MDNTAQIDSWNGPSGLKWARDADQLDQMLQPFAAAVLEAARPVAGEQVVDIGCGAGALSLAAAMLGAQVTGVDVSVPLVEIARRRAAVKGPGTQFVVADASEWQPDQKTQLLISRFGVMFFADPVAAFANIRAGMSEDGRLAFACWRSLPENDWAMVPVLTALPFLKEPPKPSPPGAPGPFAFADSEYLHSVLTKSGWNNVKVTPWNGSIQLPGLTAEDTATFMMEIGPLSRTIADQGIDPGTVRQALIDKVRSLTGEAGATQLKAAAWIVEAAV